MPRILITANTSWYLHNFRSNLIRALQAEGHDVIAVAPRDEYSERLPCAFEHIGIDQGGTNPLRDLRTAFDFWRLYRRLRPDVVLNFTPKNNIYSSLAAARLRQQHKGQTGPRIINNVAGLGLVFIEEGLTARIARGLYRMSQPLAEVVFFQNDEDQQLMLDAGCVTPQQARRLPGSGVDLEHFRPLPRPDGDSPSGEDGRRVVFLLMARMLYEKGVDDYVEAARRLREQYPAVECRLLGFVDQRNPSAIPREVIEQWHNSGAIHFLGSSDDVRQVLSEVDCVVLPSRYREGVPRSLLEGAAMAKPLVTTDNVGCRDVVENGVNGFLVPPGDVDALTAAMQKIVEMSSEEREDMGGASRALVTERFDEGIVLRAYVEACDWNLSTAD